MEDTNREELLAMLIKEHEVVQDGIIDLYLQVKVRTDEEVTASSYFHRFQHIKRMTYPKKKQG